MIRNKFARLDNAMHSKSKICECIIPYSFDSIHT
jgi:hypothetical protein